MQMRHPNGPGFGLGEFAPLAPYMTALPLRMGIEVLTGERPQNEAERRECENNHLIKALAVRSFIERNGVDPLMTNADSWGQMALQRAYFNTQMQALVNTTGAALVSPIGAGNTSTGGINQAPPMIQPRTPSPIVNQANNAATASLLTEVPRQMAYGDVGCSIHRAINTNPWIALGAVFLGAYLIAKRGR